MFKQPLILLIRTYQKFVSPLLPPGCRFHPTCSEYAAQALTQHNIFKAFYLIAIRILKCQPYHEGGSDPLKP
ncbi:MAG: membrane protein insertion efficiency factor YidD [Candidatus Nitrohelix vancouverensis]|uniref:Putative membrane protein insertion efficiency factor n=1 Tax=Candidatus Nitrohelix vancouverensis TaxID=2705534 RepID=A0A7T0C0Q5_9BACT|nr:MAG: membrane protein insertion efficiency factor YidD [Candidatus Nitrohelix vancouverensis]